MSTSPSISAPAPGAPVKSRAPQRPKLGLPPEPQVLNAKKKTTQNDINGSGTKNYQSKKNNSKVKNNNNNNNDNRKSKNKEIIRNRRIAQRVIIVLRQTYADKKKATSF